MTAGGVTIAKKPIYFSVSYEIAASATLEGTEPAARMPPAHWLVGHTYSAASITLLDAVVVSVLDSDFIDSEMTEAGTMIPLKRMFGFSSTAQ